MEIQEYLNNHENLPEFMKDFHNQKDLFKAIYDQWAEDNEILKKVNWVDAHVFTIDIFLWWMGIHGYKLQKSRKKNIDFADPEETIIYFNKKRSNSFSKILKTRFENNKNLDK